MTAEEVVLLRRIGGAREHLLGAGLIARR